MEDKNIGKLVWFDDGDSGKPEWKPGIIITYHDYTNRWRVVWYEENYNKLFGDTWWKPELVEAGYYSVCHNTM